MDYSRVYNELIKHSQNRSIPDGYTEKHHIIPKCMGGSNCKSNLVTLTAREHLFAHILLNKIYPDNKKIFFALWSMLTMKNNKMERIKNSREYEKAKISLRDYISSIHKGSKKTHTVEHRAKIGAAQIGKKLSVETKNKIKEARKLQITTEETRNKISLSNSGVNNHFYGKNHTDSSKRKISANNGSSKLVSIDGVLYPSYKEAAIKYNIHWETVKKRCKSDKWPYWILM